MPPTGFPTELQCDALLFDLDGVLVDSRAVVERTWVAWAQRHGLDPAAVLRVAHGRRTRDALRVAAPHLDCESEVVWLDTTELEDVDGLGPVNGAVRLVSELPPTAWAIVTSCGRALAHRRLERAGIPRPAVLVTSEDVAAGKPAPDGYRLGARRLGRQATACVVFEDAPAGVAAGRAAGATVVALTTTHAAAELTDADVVVADLSGVEVRPGGAGLRVTVR